MTHHATFKKYYNRITDTIIRFIGNIYTKPYTLYIPIQILTQIYIQLISF